MCFLSDVEMDTCNLNEACPASIQVFRRKIKLVLQQTGHIADPCVDRPGIHSTIELLCVDMPQPRFTGNFSELQ